MEGSTEASGGTFTLQVLSQAIGVDGVLSFSELPVNTTVAQLKTKIKEKIAGPRGEEDNQRLIHRGRLLMRSDETMAELFGASTLKDSTQSLHLALKPQPEDDQRQPPAPTPTYQPDAPRLNIFQPLPGTPTYMQTAANYPSGTIPQAPTVTGSQEQPRQDSAYSQAVQAYAAQRLDINSLHHANNHAIDASVHLTNMQAHNASQDVREMARTGLQVALERQYQAWQRAYLHSTESEERILRNPATTAADNAVRHAIRTGIEYLEAEDRIASSHGDSTQERADRDEAYTHYQQAVQQANAVIGLPPHLGPIPRLIGGQGMAGVQPHPRGFIEPFRQRPPPVLVGAGEALPVLGHGAQARPLAAGILAALLPHIWSVFKLLIFIYAFTRMDDSWEKIITVSIVAALILLYNVGALEGVWAAILRHLHDLLPMTDDPLPAPAAEVAAAGNAAPNTQQPVAGNAAQTRGSRAAEPTPEQYAARLLARGQHESRIRAQANRSAVHNFFRMIEHDVLLFFASLVPGVAEHHIAARNAEMRSRQREREREENPEQGQEARDESGVQGMEGREDAARAAGDEAGRQEAEEQRRAGGQRLGGGPRPAAVEDDAFGGVD